MAGILEVRPGVRLDSAARAYLARLRAALPASVPIVVTSGERTPEEQASAMWKKYQAGGVAELLEVYAADDVVRELVRLPADQWAAAIRRATARGVSLSRHMRKGAIDLRTRDLSAAQLEALKEAVRRTGGRPLYEDAPPHLHVDLPPGGASGAPGGAAHGAAWGLVVGAGLLLLAAAYRRRRVRALAGGG